MGQTVDHGAAAAANSFPAVVVKTHRSLACTDQLLVELVDLGGETVEFDLEPRGSLVDEIDGARRAALLEAYKLVKTAGLGQGPKFVMESKWEIMPW